MGLELIPATSARLEQRPAVRATVAGGGDPRDDQQVLDEADRDGVADDPCLLGTSGRMTIVEAAAADAADSGIIARSIPG